MAYSSQARRLYTQSPARFTVLTDEDKTALQDFFARWADRIARVLVPGGHVFIATNPLVSHLVYLTLEKAGFESAVKSSAWWQTLRGGDRPRTLIENLPTSQLCPAAAWEPWGLFRKPCEGRVQDNLRQ